MKLINFQLFVVLITVYVIYNLNYSKRINNEIMKEALLIRQKQKIDIKASNFLLGVSTSSYQTEGNLGNSNFSHWEKKKGLEKSGAACNSWDNFQQDIAALKELNTNSYRFSIEWSRIQPKRNRFKLSALKKYENFCKELKNNNIEPIVTLVHFSIPEWLEEEGGYTSDNFIKTYNKYSRKIITSLNKYVNKWVTFNEVLLMATHSYIIGRRPPGHIRDLEGFWKMIRNVCDAHVKLYTWGHNNYSNIMFSMAENIIITAPRNKYNPIDHFLHRYVGYMINRPILNALSTGKLSYVWPSPYTWYEHNLKSADTLDFIAVNHYNRLLIGLDMTKPEYIAIDMMDKTDSSISKNEMGWDVIPWSLYYAIMDVHNQYNLPIFVTEHGIAENKSKDTLRVNILSYAFACIKKAEEDGADIRGYMHWSLMDNFEWEDGREKRFGLFKTNYKKVRSKTKRLCPRESAGFYKNLINSYRGHKSRFSIEPAGV